MAPDPPRRLPEITQSPRDAHPADAIIPATREAAARLVEAGGGRVRLVTRAPERDAKFAVTRFLHEQGICVSVGHCDASLDELKAAIDAGLSMFTHLGNGCPMQMHRHDNIVQRALGLSEHLWLCFIADGAHIPFFALRNYLRLATIERCIIVTDAIAPASLRPGFTLWGAGNSKLATTWWPEPPMARTSSALLLRCRKASPI